MTTNNISKIFINEEVINNTILEETKMFQKHSIIKNEVVVDKIIPKLMEKINELEHVSDYLNDDIADTFNYIGDNKKSIEMIHKKISSLEKNSNNMETLQRVLENRITSLKIYNNIEKIQYELSTIRDELRINDSSIDTVNNLVIDISNALIKIVNEKKTIIKSLLSKANDNKKYILENNDKIDFLTKRVEMLMEKNKKLEKKVNNI